MFYDNEWTNERFPELSMEIRKPKRYNGTYMMVYEIGGKSKNNIILSNSWIRFFY